MLLCYMVDIAVELVVVMSMRALMIDRLRLSTANYIIVASQLVKLLGVSKEHSSDQPNIYLPTIISTSVEHVDVRQVLNFSL